MQDPYAASRFSFSPAYIWFFLAMAHHTSGQHDESKKLLKKAVGWTDRVLLEHDKGTAKLSWNRRLTLKLLRKEAEALLKRSDASAQPAPPDNKETPEKKKTDEG